MKKFANRKNFATIWESLFESPWLIVWLGLFVFGYSWFASLCLQLWLIPSLFSQPGASEGLVVLDSIGFDIIAKGQFEKFLV